MASMRQRTSEDDDDLLSAVSNRPAIFFRRAKRLSRSSEARFSNTLRTFSGSARCFSFPCCSFAADSACGQSISHHFLV
jgi:hypothetical protein